MDFELTGRHIADFTAVMVRCQSESIRRLRNRAIGL
jgi:hypothetical protein